MLLAPELSSEILVSTRSVSIIEIITTGLIVLIHTGIKKEDNDDVIKNAIITECVG